MKKTKNITVCVSESSYRKARVWAVSRNTSLSAAVQFLLENLSAVSQSVRTLLAQNPNFGAPASARSPHPLPKKSAPDCETVETTPKLLQNQEFRPTNPIAPQKL
jgi:hypothetical protein